VGELVYAFISTTPSSLKALMAIKSTIYKAQLHIADIDHSYYEDHTLTLARHPSETDERMMVRLVALALNAYRLQEICKGDGSWVFGAGLSDPNDPDLYLLDFTSRKRVWIEVGQPDDKPLSKACSQSDLVLVYAFNHAKEIWWNGIKNKLSRQQKLEVWGLPHGVTQSLVSLAERSMNLQATIQEQTLTFSSELGSIDVKATLMPL
jgi:uncharacterized protein YaeQ